MPIEIELRHDGVGVIVNFDGAVDIKNFDDVQNHFLCSPEVLKKVRYAIVDLTSVETLSLNYEEMVSIVERDKRIAALTPPGALVAVASPRDWVYGRMWEALLDQIGWETMTFRSRVEAEYWIQQRAKEKFGIVLADKPFHP